jgi:hypothetical protein
LSTVHLTTDALGQLQYAHTYNYYEIEQKGDAFTVTKGMRCGDDAVGVGAFAVNVDFKASWPGSASRVGVAGRKGTSVPAATGCKIDFEKWYTVRGATLPHYLDPAIPLPTADEKATATKPGWEDWDGDGNPGLTGVLSGVVAGKIFVAPRQWTQMSGSVSNVSGVFKLPVQWNQEANVMSYDGSPLLASDSAKAADPALHFTEFARLTPEQATGDDAALCKRMVELAQTLTPAAAGM